MFKRFSGIALVATALTVAASQDAAADKLDDIIASGELRCSVTLDFPPIGFRDENNEPVGFDVDYCKDLAAVLGVEPVVVETPWADRIPALISNRADVSIAAASDTLERAQTVGFSIPYMAYIYQVGVQADSDIQSFDDLKGRTVGTVVSTTNEGFMLEQLEAWGDEAGDHLSLQSEADMFLALQQGRVDAIVSSNTTVANFVANPDFDNIAVGPAAPFPIDVVGIMAPRQEYGLLRYLDLFVNRQVRSGRYQELYDKWVGGEAPNLAIPGVHR